MRRLQPSVVVSILATFPSSVNVHLFINHSTHPCIYCDRKNKIIIITPLVRSSNPQLGIGARAHGLELPELAAYANGSPSPRSEKPRHYCSSDRVTSAHAIPTTTLPRKTFLRLAILLLLLSIHFSISHLNRSTLGHRVLRPLELTLYPPTTSPSQWPLLVSVPRHLGGCWPMPQSNANQEQSNCGRSRPICLRSLTPSCWRA